MSVTTFLFLLSYSYLTIFYTDIAITILIFLSFLCIILLLLYRTEIVKALDEIFYNKDTDVEVFLTKVFVNKDFNECSICLDEFSEENDDVYKINCPCNEQFYHKSCITNWLEKNCSCPICRKVLREKDDD
jgi:hypothetical protein